MEKKKMGCVLFGTQVIRNRVAPLTTGYVLGGQSDLVANEHRRRLFRGAHFRAFFTARPFGELTAALLYYAGWGVIKRNYCLPYRTKKIARRCRRRRLKTTAKHIQKQAKKKAVLSTQKNYIARINICTNYKRDRYS